MNKGQKMRQAWERIPLAATAGVLGVAIAAGWMIAAGDQLDYLGAFLLLCAAVIGRELARDLLRRR
jgi:hypothetical protein